MTLIKGKHTLTNIDKVTNVIFGQVRFNTVRLTNTVGHVAPDSRVISRCMCIKDFLGQGGGEHTFILNILCNILFYI